MLKKVENNTPMMDIKVLSAHLGSYIAGTNSRKENLYQLTRSSGVTGGLSIKQWPSARRAIGTIR